MIVKRTLFIALFPAMVATLIPSGQITATSSDRLGGQDRYETAALVAQKVHDDGLAGTTVLLTTGENFPDAISAGAWGDEAAILLTRRDSIPTVTRNFLQSSWVTDVYAIGGTAVISDAVLSEVRSLGLNVERIAGPDRYATSIAVSRSSLDARGASSIWIASGTSFSDQLTAAAAARQTGGAFLLAAPDRSLTNTQIYEIERVRESAATPIYVIDSAVNLGAVAVNGMTVTRITGSTYKILNNTQAPNSAIVVASGENWPDALGGTRLVTSTRSLVLSRKICVPSEVWNRLNTATTSIILGGTSALSPSIESATQCPASNSFDSPVLIQGSGDRYIDYSIPFDSPAALEIRHRGESNFSIVSFNGEDDYVDLLVNEIGDYEGRILVFNELDEYQDERVRHLEISADGDWEIVAIPISYLRTFTTSATGRGDDVVRVASSADRLTLSHDGESNFIVIARGLFRYGSTWDLLVNEIGPYRGQVRLESGANLFSVQADGNWTISAG